LAERLIRYLDVPRNSQPEILIEVQHGQRLDPPRLTRAEWLAVSHVKDTGIEKYILYFLSHSGEILDFAQRDTLEQVLVEAAGSLGIQSLLWVTADLEVPNDPRIPRELLP
jgi:hypothetical protein